MGKFGNKFRKARESKNISLDDVANVTKISARMLQAIEEEHFDQLPGGVFNRGFIRAYAKHLGLNDEEAVTDYLACLRQAQIDAHEVWDPANAPTSRETPHPASAEKRSYDKPALKAQPPVQSDEELPELQLPRAEHVRPPAQKYLNPRETALPWRLLAAAAVVLVLVIILWVRHSRNTQAQAPSTKISTVASVSTSQTTPATAAFTVPGNSSVTPAPTHAAKTPPKPAPNTAQPVSSVQASSSATLAHPTQPATAGPVKTDDNKSSNATDVTIRSFPTSPQPSNNPATSMTLVIRAIETSWVSITADGQSRGQETLIAPAHTSVRASREITVRVGNAAGVTFLWNGQDIPAQGAEAEVKTFTFDSTGMHAASSAQNQ